MSDSVSGAVKALWQIQDEPPVDVMSPDDVRRRAALLDASDRRMRFVGPAIAVLFVAVFGLGLTAHTTILERAGDVLGVGAGLIMGYRIHRLNRDHPAGAAPARAAAHGYRASLVRLRSANDIAWRTMLLVGLAFALQMAAPAVAGRPKAAPVLALAVPLMLVVAVSVVRYRAYGARLRRQIAQLDATLGA